MAIKEMSDKEFEETFGNNPKDNLQDAEFVSDPSATPSPVITGPSGDEPFFGEDDLGAGESLTDAERDDLDRFDNDPAKVIRSYQEARKAMDKANERRARLEGEVEILRQQAQDYQQLIRNPQVQAAISGNNAGYEANTFSQQVNIRPAPFSSWDEFDISNPQHREWEMDYKLARYDQHQSERQRRMTLQEQRQREQRDLEEADRRFEEAHPELEMTDIRELKDYAQKRRVWSLEDAHYLRNKDRELKRAKADGRKETASRLQNSIKKGPTLRVGSGGGSARGGRTYSLEQIAAMSPQQQAKLPPEIIKKVDYWLALGGIPETE